MYILKVVTVITIIGLYWNQSSVFFFPLDFGAGVVKGVVDHFWADLYFLGVLAPRFFLGMESLSHTSQSQSPEEKGKIRCINERKFS